MPASMTDCKHRGDLKHYRDPFLRSIVDVCIASVQYVTCKAVRSNVVV